MSTIKDIKLPFREDLQVASFRGAPFFCESNSRDNGRRIVLHEFPKKDLPYAEDMGRRAKSFAIRAFCITHPFTREGDAGVLYNVDYRVARKALLDALEQDGPGTLILPTLPSEQVVVMRYRLSEEERLGGFCAFEIEFTEYGVPPQYLTMSANTNAALGTAADTLRKQAADGLTGPEPVPGLTPQVGPGPG